MAVIGRIGNPEDRKIGTKISVIHIVNSQNVISRTYFSYQAYVHEIFGQIDENLKSRYRQGLGSHLAWEEELSERFGLPSGVCKGLHLISLSRADSEKIAKEPYCREALKDPLSYLELYLTENRHCLRATLRRPSPVGLTQVIDLIGLLSTRDKNESIRDGPPQVGGYSGLPRIPYRPSRVHGVVAQVGRLPPSPRPQANGQPQRRAVPLPQEKPTR